MTHADTAFARRRQAMVRPRRLTRGYPEWKPKILAALQAGGERMWPRMREFDWAGSEADELSPQTYPAWKP